MDSESRLHVYRHAEVEPVADEPWPGTVLAGDPHTTTWNNYESADGRLLMGMWESTPGTWRVDYHDWEYCQFVSGRCVITPDGGSPIELGAGDVFVVEPGLKGTWEVIETVRKYYVFSLTAPGDTAAAEIG